MTVPSVDMLLIAGRAVFLLFSFTLATVAFIRWRRATQAQTEVVLANHGIVLQRLADLEARVDATQVAISRLAARPERPQQPASPAAAQATAPGYQIAIRLAKGEYLFRFDDDDWQAPCRISSQMQLFEMTGKAVTASPVARQGPTAAACHPAATDGSR